MTEGDSCMKDRVVLLLEGSACLADKQKGRCLRLHKCPLLSMETLLSDCRIDEEGTALNTFKEELLFQYLVHNCLTQKIIK